MPRIKCLAAALLIPLSACIFSPQHIITHGYTYTGQLKSAAPKALQCLTRNASYKTEYVPTPLPGDDAKAELIIRFSMDPSFIFSIWTITTTPEGSHYVAKLNPHTENYAKKHVDIIVRDC